MEHYLTAYDRETDEFISFSIHVPDAILARVKEIALVASTDPDAIGSYSLDVSQVHEIAKLLDRDLPLDARAVFFLEPARID